MSEVSDLLDQYRESVRLFLWYQGSPFSFHQGKASAVLAEKHRTNLHYYLTEWAKKKPT